MEFTFDIAHSQRQYIHIKARLNAPNDETIIYFPAWRPGRYELGDFAKNVNDFCVFNEQNQLLIFHKKNKNTWVVSTKDCSEITVHYDYYAAELNAGSTFLDEKQLYVNPVNCCLFSDEEKDLPIKVTLNIPKEWKIAHSLIVENNEFIAMNYDELADSPFICSSQLQHQSYKVQNTVFHVWFNGEVKPDWKRVIDDFKSFTAVQIKKYTEFPVEEYHFLFQILPYKAYHGVEHCKSTVISFGPGYAIFEDLYTEFLGVSSHELYHSWNVKSIRPIEMMPYDFKNENYSELGYIAEGVTTYMGDLMLFRSGVFDKRQYLKEMSAQIQKHADNFGRLHYSVAQSSFDTWLDGYIPGAPGRKVSIYTEGCLLAFILDVRILKKTNNQFGIDEVMRQLYFNYAKHGKGISDKDYQKTIEKVIGESVQSFFDDYVHGTNSYFPLLEESFNFLGLTLKSKPDKSFFAVKLGAKIIDQSGKMIITSIFPSGLIDNAGGMLGDEICAINGIKVEGNADEWANYFKEKSLTLLISRGNRILELNVAITDLVYFKTYYLSNLAKITENQKATFAAWSTQ